MFCLEVRELRSLYIYIYIYRVDVSQVFLHIVIWYQVFLSNTNKLHTVGPGNLGSIPGRVIPKTFKMVLDTSLYNTWQYKVRIEGKVEKSRERSSAIPYTSV